MGSDSLSCTFLTALVHAPDFEVLAVVTQPDRARGRHMRIVPGPVKEQALMHCVPVLAPEKVNQPSFLETMRKLNPDVIVVMAYGQFLGQTLLELPRLGCINLHVSLLPKFRGAAPVQHAIMKGETETGVTAMMMDIGMDTGDILGSIKCDIAPEDTTGSLSLKLCKTGADLMLNVIRKLDYGHLAQIPQNDAVATYAPKISKKQALIEWKEPAIAIERKIRAFNPKPGCNTFLPPVEKAGCDIVPGAYLKILRAEVVETSDDKKDLPPGTVLVMRRGPVILAGDGQALRLIEVHPEGRPRPMSGADFANGCGEKLVVGDRFFPGLKTIS